MTGATQVRFNPSSITSFLRQAQDEDTAGLMLRQARHEVSGGVGGDFPPK